MRVCFMFRIDNNALTIYHLHRYNQPVKKMEAYLWQLILVLQ